MLLAKGGSEFGMHIVATLLASRKSVGFVLCAILASLARADELVEFNRDIVPILSDNCFACHGPDAPPRKAGLRLDIEEGAKQALPSGNTAIVPGDPRDSVLLQRIASSEPGDRMPPPETGKALSDRERALLGRWISEGAEWRPHWALIPPQRPDLPEVRDTSWSRNAIDRFVLARLEDEGLTPSPEADRHTLIRRVSLDLTGTLPSPDEVAGFVNDSDPGAYERVLDRLLASPRYGEHMARNWLDIARYADTNGYAADIERTMWRYRDWVIDAFNANVPFDRFTIEQLAGDLLPSPTLDQRIATGFNRNHPIMMEGGAIFEEYRVQNVVDRLDTTASTWLGLTMKCAQCHDHKYDPISQHEFYQFYAFFNNVAEEESKLFGTELDGNSLPRIKAPVARQIAERARLEKELEGVRAEKLRPIVEVDASQQTWEEQERTALADRWTTLELVRLPDETGTDTTAVFSGETALHDITALRIDVASREGEEAAPAFILGELEVYIVPARGSAEEARVEIAESFGSVAGSKHAHDGDIETGLRVELAERPARAVFSPEAPFGFADGTRIRVVLQGRFVAGFAESLRFSASTDRSFLPSHLGSWQVNGPYVADNGVIAPTTDYVDAKQIDLSATYEDGRAKWTTPPDGLRDGTVHTLPGKICATYFHRTITAPSPRRMDIALDNRNAVRLWVNGRLVFDKEAQRGEVAAHPAPATIELREGENSILVKVVDYYDFNAHTFFFVRKGEDVGPLPLALERALLQAPAQRSADQADALREFYRSRTWDGWAPLHDQQLNLEWALALLDKQIPTTMVMEDLATPRPANLLVRGHYDQPGETVSPGVPAALHSWPDGAPLNRMGLAQWIVAPENPLTARVAVNRDWQRYFGAGIVRTPDDFGVQGARPSHPELLDWLAREFVESGWDSKAMQRLIVTSATYRQASRQRPELAGRDADNRLLSRGPRYRLDAEQIRDNALTASGLLVEKIGGPSVKPYQPAGLWKDVAYGGGGQRYTAQEFTQDHGENLYRRSLYTFWKRAAAPPGMLLFDAPNRDICTARRSRSNTPLQALVLMNDVQYVEASRALACRVMKEAGPGVVERIAHASTLVFARLPSPAEEAALLRQFEAQRADYSAAPEFAKELLEVGESDIDPALDPVELAAWTMLASVLLNTDAAVSQF